jgi:hypothetical protein
MLRTALRSLAATLLLASGVARAGGYFDDFHPYQTYWSAGWDIGIPVGSLSSNWVKDVSINGMQFEMRVGIVGRLSVGLAFNYNWFDQNYPNVTVEQPSYTFTGPVYRRLEAFGVRATTHYYLTQTSLQPYVGIGIGVVWGSALRGTVNKKEEFFPTAFAVDPEVGLLWTIIPRFGFYALARYQFTLAGWADVKNAQWFSGQVGAAWYL